MFGLQVSYLKTLVYCVFVSDYRWARRKWSRDINR